ncbi:MAG: tRNA pseudouridine(38-40) synthase TruA [Opitutales bacterium]|nr:tRNA pseudouridine(38-40) synthase TruA [Opitutales bacterium]MCH8540097.1 tRNA pseudouridine(38-40) synthase TruA [Opitutales bacterium]
MSSAKQNPVFSRWKCECAYHGGHFFGWQTQKNHRSVQTTIQEVLEGIVRHPVVLHGSSRTDTGVHARGFVFHFDSNWKHPGERLLAALRSRLPGEVQVTSAKKVSMNFHARFSAKRKRYIYYLWEGHTDPFQRPFMFGVPVRLDTQAMQEAANYLVGRKDFRAFSAEPGHPQPSTVRNLMRLDVLRKGREVRIIAEADGFLYKMVRSLVGGLIKVGRGDVTPEEIKRIQISRQRTSKIPSARAHGLFLDKVFYR